MTTPVNDRADLFLRFSRRNLIALLFIVLLLGSTALALMLSPKGAVARTSNLSWWMLPIALAVFIIIPAALQARRWAPDSPEVKLVMQDEFRRTNLDRASRLALIVILLAQWPLAVLIGMFLSHLGPPRPAMAMAASTITLGLVTLISLFLYFDRD